QCFPRGNFAFPERSRKTLQRPEHLHLLAERRYKKSPAFWARDYSWKRVYSAFSSTGVVEVKGEVNAA
ncbi:hypothetical protein NLR80_26875, partial [Escherichia coli]|nr:hypothetical protein [Escherichia coli]